MGFLLCLNISVLYEELISSLYKNRLVNNGPINCDANIIPR